MQQKRRCLTQNNSNWFTLLTATKIFSVFGFIQLLWQAYLAKKMFHICLINFRFVYFNSNYKYIFSLFLTIFYLHLQKYFCLWLLMNFLYLACLCFRSSTCPQCHASCYAQQFVRLYLNLTPLDEHTPDCVEACKQLGKCMTDLERGRKELKKAINLIPELRNIHRQQE